MCLYKLQAIEGHAKVFVLTANSSCTELSVMRTPKNVRIWPCEGFLSAGEPTIELCENAVASLREVDAVAVGASCDRESKTRMLNEMMDVLSRSMWSNQVQVIIPRQHAATAKNTE